ncbi:MAG: hypothetical protein Q9212_002471 [Teloschistes hypoglaucus]
MYIPLAASALALFSLASGQLANYGRFTASSPTEAMTIGSIHNVLALFNLALDSKNFEALRDVYTTDIKARVARVPTNDIDSLIRFYNGTALGDVVTQHTAHTIFVYDLQRESAKSISYANALYFSKVQEGQIFARDVDTFYERYDDVWQRQKDGRWLIKERSINIYAQVGNSSLVPPTQPTFNTSKV